MSDQKPAEAVPEVKRFEELEITFGDYRLRQMNESDKELALEKFNEELIQRWMAVPTPFLEVNFYNWMKFQASDQEAGGGIWWVIEQDGVALGQIWFRKQNWREGIAEIGYLAFPEARGKGMVPFLVRNLAELAINKYKMNRVHIVCDVENENSGRAALKAGFKFEGVQRNGMLYRDEPRDINCYSMVPADLL